MNRVRVLSPYACEQRPEDVKRLGYGEIRPNPNVEKGDLVNLVVEGPVLVIQLGVDHAALINHEVFEGGQTQAPGKKVPDLRIQPAAVGADADHTLSHPIGIPRSEISSRQNKV